MAGKTDWFAAGLPSDGKAAEMTRIGDLVDGEVPTCGLDEKVGDVRARVGPDDVCLVVNDHRVVLGLVEHEDLDGADDDRPVGDVMQDGPSTIRPNVPAAVLAEHLEHGPAARALVTTPEGKLVGLLRASALEAWAQKEGLLEAGSGHEGHDHD